MLEHWVAEDWEEHAWQLWRRGHFTVDQVGRALAVQGWEVEPWRIAYARDVRIGHELGRLRGAAPR